MLKDLLLKERATLQTKLKAIDTLLAQGLTEGGGSRVRSESVTPTSRHWKHWTKEEDAILLANLDKKVSRRKIAKIMGRSKSAIDVRVSNIK